MQTIAERPKPRRYPEAFLPTALLLLTGCADSSCEPRGAIDVAALIKSCRFELKSRQ